MAPSSAAIRPWSRPSPSVAAPTSRRGRRSLKTCPQTRWESHAVAKSTKRLGSRSGDCVRRPELQLGRKDEGKKAELKLGPTYEHYVWNHRLHRPSARRPDPRRRAETARVS